MANTANLKNVYAEKIAPALMKQFNYSSPMQIPVLKKIVVNQGLGSAQPTRRSSRSLSTRSHKSPDRNRS